ncbi:TasA family protein [Neobacillus sp. YX16]|uniref:TasA family protein n=1 Tax=Neobacillus sp. YX16 TaxID=3047874 RepID=UPI0024C33A53|nr:TasA family protein [Neobacillus sp. YX16]WHZ01424.1 TasA family protein [Neobacillus sp. YX16]
MSIKKKLGLGMASAALGLSLVGGGTFAYFNDVDTINNKLANGTLDLAIKVAEEGTPINFDLANLKPGDSVSRMFKLDADGSLAIQKVLMELNANPADFKDALGSQTGDHNAMKDFLKQFHVTVLRGQIEPDPNNNIQVFKQSENGDAIATTTTLYDLWEANPLNGSGSLATKIKAPFYDTATDTINLTPTGLPVTPDDKDGVQITIKFHDDGTNQNRFQGDSAKFQFVLTATQYAGTSVAPGVDNGYLKGNEYIQQNGNGNVEGASQVIWSNEAKNISETGSETPVVPGTDVPGDN